MQGFRNAMIRDGVALVRFYRWMEKALANGELDELTIAEKLREYRSKQDKYVGESFNTIAGYAGHGAIVHYSATEASNVKVERKGLLLIDSGAQFMDGTTDITRTWAVGETTKQMRIDYTNVLKGHIALATAIFPQGTAVRSSMFWLVNLFGTPVKLIGTGQGTASAISSTCTKGRRISASKRIRLRSK